MLRLNENDELILIKFPVSSVTVFAHCQPHFCSQRGGAGDIWSHMTFNTNLLCFSHVFHFEWGIRLNSSMMRLSCYDVGSWRMFILCLFSFFLVIIDREWEPECQSWRILGCLTALTFVEVYIKKRKSSFWVKFWGCLSVFQERQTNTKYVWTLPELIIADQRSVCER